MAAKLVVGLGCHKRSKSPRSVPFVPKCVSLRWPRYLEPSFHCSCCGNTHCHLTSPDRRPDLTSVSSMRILLRSRPTRCRGHKLRTALEVASPTSFNSCSQTCYSSTSSLPSQQRVSVLLKCVLRNLNSQFSGFKFSPPPAGRKYSCNGQPPFLSRDPLHVCVIERHSLDAKTNA